VLVTGAKAMQPPTRGPYRVLFAADGTPRAEAVAQSLAAFLHDGHISASVVHLAAQEPVHARTPATRTARAVGRWLPDGVLRSTGTVFPRDPSASEADQLLQAAADTKASVVALTLRPSWLQRRLVKRGLAGQLLGQCAFPLIFGH
jgi:hypothetical protein